MKLNYKDAFFYPFRGEKLAEEVFNRRSCRFFSFNFSPGFRFFY